MARSIVRSMPIYYDGKKIAETESASFDISSGDELQHGIDGVLGHSDGHITVRIETTCIIPVKGTSVTLLEDMLAKNYITMGAPIGGKMLYGDYRIDSASYSSDSKSGKLSGKFTFSGGKPDSMDVPGLGI